MRRMDASGLVTNECNRVLNEYIADPWWCPRETDLVPNMVYSLQKELGPQAFVESHLRGARFDGMDAQRRVPRVRTELRLNGDKTRVDLCVLGATPVTTYVRGNGPRDVERRTVETEVSAAIEVKLEPGLTQVGWLADVRKLHWYRKVPLRVVLWVDTSLPLESVGATYRRDKRCVARANDSVMPPWPLRPESFSVAGFLFEHQESPGVEGLYLAALAVDRSVGVEQFTKLLGSQEVHAAWWKATPSQ